MKKIKELKDLEPKQIVEVMTNLSNSKEWKWIKKDLEVRKAELEYEIIESWCLVKKDEIKYTALWMAIKDLELQVNYKAVIEKKLKNVVWWEFILTELDIKREKIREKIFSTVWWKWPDDKRYCYLDLYSIERIIIDELLQIPEWIIKNFDIPEMKEYQD